MNALCRFYNRNCELIVGGMLCVALVLVLALSTGCISLNTGKSTTKASASWGPAISWDKTTHAPEAAGNANVQLSAGEDVGYHLQIWRNKSAPNIKSSTEGGK